MPTFKVQGHVSHMEDSLLPYRSDDHTFADFFIADTDTQVSRCNIYSKEALRLHINEIDTSNVTWIQSFQTAIENLPSNVPDYKRLIRTDKVRLMNIANNVPSTRKVTTPFYCKSVDRQTSYCR